jgi:cytidylate kinase
VNKLQIIGLSGTNGSGKDAAGLILADKHGYLFISVTELLRNEAKRRGLPVEREVLRTVSAEWRRELGLGVLVDKAVAEYEKDADKDAGVVMASLRNPGEADRIHEFGGTMVWLDADPHVRYERIQANAAHRDRAEEENLRAIPSRRSRGNASRRWRRHRHPGYRRRQRPLRYHHPQRFQRSRHFPDCHRASTRPLNDSYPTIYCPIYIIMV